MSIETRLQKLNPVDKCLFPNSGCTRKVFPTRIQLQVRVQNLKKSEKIKNNRS